jgi:dTDP-4-amino-4,6-dideoxygalactose transaminase
MEELWRIGERFGLPIIEDAAQSFGATYQGKQCGTLGALACFSFYPTKNLATYGDAGMVVTNDPEWAERMTTLRVHGMKPKYHHGMLGWNARIDAVQAAILRVKLPHVDRCIQGREAAANRYDSLIRSRGRRDALVQRFQAERIGYEIYYPVPVHLQKCVAHLGCRAGDFPVSEQASQEVFALPMFPEITPEQQERVIEVCASQLLTTTRQAA